MSPLARRSLPALAACLLVGLAAPAQTGEPTTPPAQRALVATAEEAVVYLTSGQQVSGLLVERNERRIVLRLSGIETPLPAEKVSRVTMLPPVIERYRDMRAQISRDDVASLYQLALWLEQRERYDLVIDEIDRVLEVEPTDRRAIDTRRRLLARKQLAEKIRERQRTGGDQEPTRSPVPERDVQPDMKRLTPEDVNLIRVFEVNMDDPPNIAIERESIEKLIERYKDNPDFPPTEAEREAILEWRPLDVLALIYSLRARDMYGDVRVLEDPASMALFRERVHRPLIMNSCATSECHAGAGAGRLRFVREKMFSDQTVYTNFLILDRFRLDDGSPLVDYEHPEQSPLLQMALDREVSTHPHPVVPGPTGRGDEWRPIIRGEGDRRLEDTIRWISMMYRPRPDYPIELAPPPPPTEAPKAEGPPR